jgi:hypothetical protein
MVIFVPCLVPPAKPKILLMSAASDLLRKEDPDAVVTFSLLLVLTIRLCQHRICAVYSWAASCEIVKERRQ